MSILRDHHGWQQYLVNMSGSSLLSQKLHVYHEEPSLMSDMLFLKDGLTALKVLRWEKTKGVYLQLVKPGIRLAI